MSSKPIFVATHPRACSTAFEMVFMTRPGSLTCVHEPFGDAFYYGPERLSDRYEKDEKAREDSGFSDSTYKTIFERLDEDSAEGKRIFIKDITHYLLPPNGAPASIAPSLVHYKRGVGTSGEVNGDDTRESNPSDPPNPTVVPTCILRQFHFTFLIRQPKLSIPSYYRCTTEPLCHTTGFYDFKPCEAGYDELRRTFDYLRAIGAVGPGIAGQKTAPVADAGSMAAGALDAVARGEIDICVIDADDLLDRPAEVIEAFCKSVGLDFNEKMLQWDTEEEISRAQKAFSKWPGFHDDALAHKELKPREHKKKEKSDEDCEKDWVRKFGEEGAKVIRECVQANLADYAYLKSFAIKI